MTAGVVPSVTVIDVVGVNVMVLALTKNEPEMGVALAPRKNFTLLIASSHAGTVLPPD